MIRLCPRCKYRGAILPDGYGEATCLQCGFSPLSPQEQIFLAELTAEKDSGNRIEGQRRTGARLREHV